MQCEKCEKWRLLPHWAYPADEKEREDLMEAESFHCGMEKKLNLACFSRELTEAEYEEKFKKVTKAIELKGEEQCSLLHSFHHSEQLSEPDLNYDDDDIINVLISQESVQDAVAKVQLQSSFFEVAEEDEESKKFSSENIMKTLEEFRKREEEEDAERLRVAEEEARKQMAAHQERVKEVQQRRAQLQAKANADAAAAAQLHYHKHVQHQNAQQQLYQDHMSSKSLAHSVSSALTSSALMGGGSSAYAPITPRSVPQSPALQHQAAVLEHLKNVQVFCVTWPKGNSFGASLEPQYDVRGRFALQVVSTASGGLAERGGVKEGDYVLRCEGCES